MKQCAKKCEFCIDGVCEFENFDRDGKLQCANCSAFQKRLNNKQIKMIQRNRKRAKKIIALSKLMQTEIEQNTYKIGGYALRVLDNDLVASDCCYQNFLYDTERWRDINE